MDMKLISLHIENFGKIKDFDYEFEPGINCIIQENGWGKSTLSAFIKVMLYGFDGEKKRQGISNERKRYMPWQGGAYGGSLTFSHNGKTYRIDKIFGSKEAEDTCVLYDEATGLLSKDFRPERIGEELLGIDLAGFSRTVFISQEDCNYVGLTDSINHKLGNIAEQTEDANGYDTVVTNVKKAISDENSKVNRDSLYCRKKSLEELRQELRRAPVIENLIASASESINENERHYNLLLDKRGQAIEVRNRTSACEKQQLIHSRYIEFKKKSEVRKEELLRLERELGGYIPSKVEINKAFGAFNELASLDSQIKLNSLSEDENREYIDLLNGSARALRVVISENEGAISKGKASFFMAICGAMAWAVLGLLFMIKLIPALIINETVTGALTIALAAILFIIGIIFRRKNRTREEIKKSLEQKEIRFSELARKAAYIEELEKKADDVYVLLADFMSKMNLPYPDDCASFLFDLQTKVAAYEKAGFEYEEAERELRAFVNEYPDSVNEVNIEPGYDESVNIDETIIAFEQEIIEISKHLEADRSRLNGYLQEQENLQNLQEREAELVEICDELEDRLRILNLTKDYLEKAKVAYTEKYTAPLTKGFRKYYELISGSDGDNYKIDAKSNIYVREYGLDRDTELLSKGYMNMVGLCMRLALSETMYDGSIPFIIMDDPFVNLDNENNSHALEVIRALAQKNQIIYMTCHESRVISEIPCFTQNVFY